MPFVVSDRHQFNHFEDVSRFPDVSVKAKAFGIAGVFETPENRSCAASESLRLPESTLHDGVSTYDDRAWLNSRGSTHDTPETPGRGR